MEFADIPQFPRAYWNATFDWSGLEYALERWSALLKHQRGWNPAHQGGIGQGTYDA